MAFIVLLLFGAATAYLASRKNRNPLVWGVLGFIFNIAAIGVIFFLKPGNFAELANSVELENVEKIPQKDKSEYDQSFLDKFIAPNFVNNNSKLEICGVMISIIITAGVVIAFFNLGVVPGIILSIMILLKFDTIKKHLNNTGFGKGVLIYAIYICLVFAVFAHMINTNAAYSKRYMGENPYDLSSILLIIVIGIIGAIILPKVNNNAQKAAPFMNFLFSAGLLFFLLNIRSNSDGFTTDDSVAVYNDNTVLANSDIVSAASYDMSNNINIDHTNVTPPTMPADATIALANIGVTDSPMPMNVDSSSTFIDFVTPSNIAPQPTPVEYQISDSAGMIQGHIISDGETAQIYNNDNVATGTISQDGGALTLKDTQQNTILTRDSSGFILTPEGTPIAHVENSGLVDTIRDTETNKIIIRDEISGVMRDSDGNVLGRINKK